MSTTTSDPIADMLSRIRNALAVHKTEIKLPHSKSKEAVARLLQANRYIAGVKVTDATIGKTLTLQLTADGSNSPITEIVRLSKPGRRLAQEARDHLLVAHNDEREHERLGDALGYGGLAVAWGTRKQYPMPGLKPVRSENLEPALLLKNFLDGRAHLGIEK